MEDFIKRKDAETQRKEKKKREERRERVGCLEQIQRKGAKNAKDRKEEKRGLKFVMKASVKNTLMTLRQNLTPPASRSNMLILRGAGDVRFCRNVTK